MFEIYGSDRGLSVRRATGERWYSFIKPAVKYAGENIQVWTNNKDQGVLTMLNSLPQLPDLYVLITLHDEWYFCSSRSGRFLQAVFKITRDNFMCACVDTHFLFWVISSRDFSLTVPLQNQLKEKTKPSWTKWSGDEVQQTLNRATLNWADSRMVSKPLLWCCLLSNTVSGFSISTH